MKILLAADLHIGRSSSRIPESIDPKEVRAARAWQRLVGFAIDERVEVVCLAGDIADQDNKFWEAIGPLEEGIRQLSAAGIETFAVSGNHDHDVLVRLADQLPSEQFRLLGRGGKWERHTIKRDGRSLLHIDGWSFPQKVVEKDPLLEYDLLAASDAPTLGMVHGDLYDATSRYAPLDLNRLQGRDVSGWLLGHIHAPRLIEDPDRPWVLYPGSVQALDPGEPGPRGVWLTSLSESGLTAPEQRPISSVQYCSQTDIDLSDAQSEEDLEGKLFQSIREKAEHEILQVSNAHLAYLSMRFRLVGRTPMASIVCDVAEQAKSELELTLENTAVGIEQIDVQTLPVIDLHEHAKTATVVGALAKILLNLEEDEATSDVQQLGRLSRESIQQSDLNRDFTGLKKRSLLDDEVRKTIRAQAQTLLTELLAQTSESNE